VGREPIPSVLDPRVTGGDARGILSVYSLSKQSNLAGYRAAFLAGDPRSSRGS
jgi:aspartate/methionine/tyrosine aminotransferase